MRKVLSALEAAGVEYILVGSVAPAAYGEPRLTLDIDVVWALTPGQLPRFLSSFPDPDYYCSREAASEAIHREGQFHIIHPGSGLKVDVIMKRTDEFDRSRFARISDGKDPPWIDPAGLRQACLTGCPGMRTRRGRANPKVSFRTVHVAADGRRCIPAGASRGKTIEVDPGDHDGAGR